MLITASKFDHGTAPETVCVSPLLLLIIAFVTISDTPEFLNFIENGFTTNFELYKSIFVLIISNKFLALAFIMLIIASYFQIMTLLIVNDKKIKKVNIQIIIIRALTLNYFIDFLLNIFKDFFCTFRGIYNLNIVIQQFGHLKKLLP